ncbi:histone deacetylation protein Rxt3-domain-containing protein, partial [Dipodascopsis tothii]|uniref:histone deacetylation protein Rxt3-domain-containing protein n=1 Tax=Dipodascopsis tothii TaxID=44089 RepID=UPI0034D00103
MGGSYDEPPSPGSPGHRRSRPPSRPPSRPASANAAPGPRLVVRSDETLAAADRFPRLHLGSLVYTPTPDSAKYVRPAPTYGDLVTKSLLTVAGESLIPRGLVEAQINAVLQIRIPYRFLNREKNPHVLHRELWGTDIYTDDSDVVAALYHQGYLPHRPAADESRPTAVPDTRVFYLKEADCVATIRILPRLERYVGSYKHELNSRSWLKGHDGMSFQIENVRFVRRGKAEDRGGPMKKQRLAEWGASRE